MKRSIIYLPVLILFFAFFIFTTAYANSDPQNVHINSSFNITVDYSHSLEEMIKSGGYDYINSYIIEKNFSLNGRGIHKFSAVIFHFENVSMSPDAIIVEMNKRGYRPAKIEELLAVGKNHPNIQRKFPIVAMGSIWKRTLVRRRVSYLGGSDENRILSIYRFNVGWRSVYRFLAVRN